MPSRGFFDENNFKLQISNLNNQRGLLLFIKVESKTRQKKFAKPRWEAKEFLVFVKLRNAFHILLSQFKVKDILIS